MLAVLVAGCTLPQDVVNGTNITAINVTKVTSTPINAPVTNLSTIQTQCPIWRNTTPYITINPVGVHYLGDMIEINGTTNCNGGEILIGIKDANFHLCPRNAGSPDAPCPCCDGVLMTSPIIPGICGNNSWSSKVDTSQHHFYPGEFYVEVINEGCGVDDPYFEYFNINSVP